jgi:molybdate transport system substrate-binding protein
MKIPYAIVLSIFAMTIDGLAVGNLHAQSVVQIIANPGMKPVFEELTPQFERASGHKIVVQYGLFDQLRERIEAGDFDVAITTGKTADYKFIDGTRTGIARVGIGVVIRAGAPKPDISTTESFKRALLDAKSISYTKGSTAGTYLAGLMERLGIAEEMKQKTKLMGGGGQNPKAVAAGEIELGLSIISDILPVAGVEVLGPLPPELQNYVMETAGVGIATKDRAAADALIAFLKGPIAKSIFKAKGFEPITQ